MTLQDFYRIILTLAVDEDRQLFRSAFVDTMPADVGRAGIEIAYPALVMLGGQAGSNFNVNNNMTVTCQLLAFDRTLYHNDIEVQSACLQRMFELLKALPDSLDYTSPVSFTTFDQYNEEYRYDNDAAGVLCQIDFTFDTHVLCEFAVDPMVTAIRFESTTPLIIAPDAPSFTVYYTVEGFSKELELQSLPVTVTLEGNTSEDTTLTRNGNEIMVTFAADEEGHEFTLSAQSDNNPFAKANIQIMII
jgi:hypothetical protein